MNNCSFIGNLTRDPETRMAGSTPVAQFGIAVNRSYKKASGELVKEVSFLDMEVWGQKQSDLLVKYWKKGDPIVIASSRAKQESWEDKTTGQRRSAVRFQVDRFEFAPKNSGGTRVETSESNDDSPADTAPPTGTEEIPF